MKRLPIALFSLLLASFVFAQTEEELEEERKDEQRAQEKAEEELQRGTITHFVAVNKLPTLYYNSGNGYERLSYSSRNLSTGYSVQTVQPIALYVKIPEPENRPPDFKPYVPVGEITVPRNFQRAIVLLVAKSRRVGGMVLDNSEEAHPHGYVRLLNLTGREIAVYLGDKPELIKDKPASNRLSLVKVKESDNGNIPFIIKFVERDVDSNRWKMPIDTVLNLDTNERKFVMVVRITPEDYIPHEEVNGKIVYSQDPSKLPDRIRLQAISDETPQGEMPKASKIIR